MQEMKELMKGPYPRLFDVDGRGFIVGNECAKMGISDRSDVFRPLGFKELIEFIES